MTLLDLSIKLLGIFYIILSLITLKHAYTNNPPLNTYHILYSILLILGLFLVTLYSSFPRANRD